MIDSSQVVERHFCPMPPQILVHGDADNPIRMAHPEGTRFICDGCGSVKVVAWVRSGYVNVMDGWEWVDETRRQRRTRLGLRWWQRE